MEATRRRPTRRRAALIATALVGVLLLASCSSSSTSSSSTTQTTGSASALPPLDDAALKTTVDQLAKELMTPGAVVLVRTPDGEFRDAYGTTTVGGTTPVSFDDHVRIGSNTKPFTGTVILQLAQEGKLSLDDPVSKYRPDVPNGDNITITQLLNMRSGLFNYSETVDLNRSLDDNPGKEWTPDELLALAFSHPPYFAPGQGYHYSNTNTVLLGLIAEQLDGKPLATIFQDRLFTPLGLTQTSFPPSNTAAMPDPHPQGYMYGTNVETMDSPVLPADQQAAAAAGTLLPNDVTDENPSWTWAAGQAISTADDLATWAKALGDGSVLNAEWQQKRIDSLQPTDPSNPSSSRYGLALAGLGPLYGHTGELPGFNSVALYDPVHDVTLVVWANLGSAPDGRAVATTIAQAVLAQVYGSGGGAGASSETTTP